MTQLDTVLGFIKTMDTKMLDEILDGEVTYQGTSKKIFLNKLDLVFAKFKIKGDSAIEIEYGKCQCPKCEIGNKKGYVLIGNNSRQCLDLMFELSAEWKVLDIYYCNEYGLVDDCYVPYDFEHEKDDLDVFGYNSIKLYPDEKLDFIATERYCLMTEKCKEAFEEIENGDEKHISFEIINDWLRKYKNLVDVMIGNYYTTTFKFAYLYSDLGKVQPYFTMLYYTDRAMKLYNEGNYTNENDLIEWLIKHQNLGCSLLVTFNMDFIETEKDGKKWYLSNDYNFYFLPDDFKSIIEFKNLFDSKYWSLLEKHIEIFEREHNRELEMDYRNLNYIINYEPF